MARSFSVQSLSRDQVATVFPLISAAYPATTPAVWTDFGRSLAERSPSYSGALGLKNEAGYFCGVLIYRNDRDAWHEPELAVDLFVALDLINVGAAAKALLEAAETQAAELGCTRIHIQIDKHNEVLVRSIRNAGYSVIARLFDKEVSASATN